MTLSFDPQAGREQKGRRPAIVVSKHLFNKHTGLAMVCPITRTDRRVPLHAPLRPGSAVTGFVMVEQVKSIDYGSRRAKFIEKGSEPLVNEVLSLLEACIF